MSLSRIVDTNAWRHYFQRKTRPHPIVSDVQALMTAGGALIHPVVAGEVLLGGVDPYDAFDGLPWVESFPDMTVLTWLRGFPRPVLQKVGWADCQIAYAAYAYEVEVLTADAGLVSFMTKLSQQG